jgi:hypothetical protein
MCFHYIMKETDVAVVALLLRQNVSLVINYHSFTTFVYIYMYIVVIVNTTKRNIRLLKVRNF